jgi:hypothetical protein
VSTATLDPTGDPLWDASDLVRAWLLAGGMPALDAVAVDGAWTTTARAPVPWSGLLATPEELRAEPWRVDLDVERVRVTPAWVDRTCGQAFAPYDYYKTGGTLHPAMALPGHDAFLAHMAEPPSSSVDARWTSYVIEVLANEAVQPDLLAEAVVRRHEANCLGLGRLVKQLARAADVGGLQVAWPHALTIADTLCAAPKRPSALGELLRFLATYLVEVPNRALPEGIARLAASPGTSRGHTEARALMALADRLRTDT